MIPRTDKNEITGANQDENKVALLGVKIKKKLPVFFKGEVFFYLTDPLMGDPIHRVYPSIGLSQL
jgi:hypothetical protein